MNPALELIDVHYAFTSDWMRRKIPVLKGVSVEVNSGESFGFLGHNGAGKTTAIKCVLDLIRPQQGVIKISGIESSRTDSRLFIGYLPEQPYFYDNLTVFEMLTLYGVLAGVPSSELSSRINFLLERLGLESKRRSRMRALSKGLMQRVGLAQAIIAKPKLLILDEPFSGLDPVGRKEFREIFTELKSQGTTIFMSSHILSDVEFLCDRVSIMVKGEIRGVYSLSKIPELVSRSYEVVLFRSGASSGIEEKFRGRSGVRFSSNDLLLSFSFDDEKDAETLLRDAVQAGAHVQGYQCHQGSLEELFIEVTRAAQKGDTSHKVG